MDAPGDDVLADARLSLEQHSGIRVRYGLRFGIEPLHGPALHDERIAGAAAAGVVQVLERLQELFLRSYFAAQIGQGRHVTYDRHHVGHPALFVADGMAVKKQATAVENILHAFDVLTCLHDFGIELRVKDAVQHHILHAVADYVLLGYAREL